MQTADVISTALQPLKRLKRSVKGSCKCSDLFLRPFPTPAAHGASVFEFYIKWLVYLINNQVIRWKHALFYGTGTPAGGSRSREVLILTSTAAVISWQKTAEAPQWLDKSDLLQQVRGYVQHLHKVLTHWRPSPTPIPHPESLKIQL